MTRFDTAPLFRSTVGFDRMMRLLESAALGDEAERAFPPYNIQAVGENAYRITLAVAGYVLEDLNIEVKDSMVTVTCKPKEQPKDAQFLYQGIAGGGFERRFQLADYVEVVSANLENGLLSIDLKRELPERMKPRTVEIGTAGTKTIEGSAKTSEKAA